MLNRKKWSIKQKRKSFLVDKCLFSLNSHGGDLEFRKFGEFEEKKLTKNKQKKTSMIRN